MVNLKNFFFISLLSVSILASSGCSVEKSVDEMNQKQDRLANEAHVISEEFKKANATLKELGLTMTEFIQLMLPFLMDQTKDLNQNLKEMSESMKSILSLAKTFIEAFLEELTKDKPPSDDGIPDFPDIPSDEKFEAHFSNDIQTKGASQ